MLNNHDFFIRYLSRTIQCKKKLMSVNQNKTQKGALPFKEKIRVRGRIRRAEAKYWGEYSNIEGLVFRLQSFVYRPRPSLFTFPSPLPPLLISSFFLWHLSLLLRSWDLLWFRLSSNLFTQFNSINLSNIYFLFGIIPRRDKNYCFTDWLISHG